LIQRILSPVAVRTEIIGSPKMDPTQEANEYPLTVTNVLRFLPAGTRHLRLRIGSIQLLQPFAHPESPYTLQCPLYSSLHLRDVLGFPLLQF